MKLVVFTPTYRHGGLDVLEASLMRQTFRNFFWVVSDELYHDRVDTWKEIDRRVDFPIVHIGAPKKEGNKRNLCAAYNLAAEIAQDAAFIRAMVSLQDYMYIEEDGLERFANFCKDNPNDLITGVTHISRDPFPTKAIEISGKYSVFEEPFTDKPKRMSWEDVRVTEIYRNPNEVEIINVETAHWEANWAAVPSALLRRGARWNEEYDAGIAYENMDFAKRCEKKYGSKVYLDTKNVAISLPHKDYFKGEREEIERYSNRERYERDWH